MQETVYLINLSRQAWQVKKMRRLLLCCMNRKDVLPTSNTCLRGLEVDYKNMPIDLQVKKHTEGVHCLSTILFFFSLPQFT